MFVFSFELDLRQLSEALKFESFLEFWKFVLDVL
jgi:hypothetical protein